MKWCWFPAYPLIFVALVPLLRAQPTALNDGVKLLREGQFEQALIKLEQAHHITPRNATIENLLGITETRLGHVDKANKHYHNAIRLDPSQAAPHKNLGFNLLTAKDFAEAEPELREALRLTPGDNFVHYYLMLLALATGRDAEALEQAERAGQLLNNDPEAGAELVEVAIRLGRVDEAFDRIRQLEQSNRLPSEREYAIAVLLSQHSFYKQAVYCFRHIASINPSWESRYNLALALLYSSEPGEASAILATLHTEHPANADVLMFQGLAFEIQQKLPEALEAYRSAVVADPSNPDRILDYTRLLMDMDCYDEAIQVILSSMEQTSATALLQLRLGAVEMVKRNYDAARDAFHTALIMDPQLDAAYVGLAQTYARQANDTEAIRILEAARAKLPNHYRLEYYFGMLASRLNREPEAVVALESAARLEPRSPDPFYELGKLYAAQQNWPKARQVLEHVIKLNPQFVPAHYQLSHIYAHMGLDAKAEEEAQKTHALVDAQRDQAIRKQREQGSNFQPQHFTASSPQP